MTEEYAEFVSWLESDSSSVIESTALSILNE